MSKPIIEVQNLSKRYRLGRIGATTLREDLARGWSRLRGNAPAEDQGDFWALRDVSLTVQPGEVLGVIGRNGAGKSTLLKVLSRITEPTTGRAILRGRVASLLEVGTGFHQDLTGRENVFLNGAILGMKHMEIAARFDEIVSFAEVSKFIDTPVKHYSSGMRVRLAFAVAAHLDSEIMIVDEVLAVGDAAFQRRSMEKMRDLVSRDRTVLFVSHHLQSMLQFCDRCVLMQEGRLIADGPVRDIVDRYQQDASPTVLNEMIDLTNTRRSGGDGQVRFGSVQVLNSSGEVISMIEERQPFTLRLHLHSNISSSHLELGYSLKTTDGSFIYTASSQHVGLHIPITQGMLSVETTLMQNLLKPGRYILHLGVTCGGLCDLIPEAAVIEIKPASGGESAALHALPGPVRLEHQWRVLP